MLPHGPPRPPELGHIRYGLGSQALEFLVGVAQDLDHGLQTAQVGDGTTDLDVLGDVLEDLQRTDLCEKYDKESNTMRSLFVLS